MKNIVLLLIIAILNSCKPEIQISGNVSTPGGNYVDHPALVDTEFIQSEVKETEANQVDPESDPEPIEVESKQHKLIRIYEGEIGVREKTGKNDGKDVEKYLKSVGLGKGNPWCAAFVHWSLNQAGIKNSITAYSPTAYSKKRVVWKNGWKKQLMPGHVFTLYYSNLGRIGHTGFVHRKVNDKFVETVEGNTNGEGSREGDGVYRKKRSLNSLFAICDWY